MIDDVPAELDPRALDVLPRNFIGYGASWPVFSWPTGAKVAVNIVLNYEEGGEYSLPDGDGRNDSWGEYTSEIPPTVRDLGTETHYEFGSRVGIWRLTRLFDELGIPVTIGAAARALERNPAVADWIRERGHDVIGHGLKWSEDSRAPRAEEARRIAEGTRILTALVGTAPLGWYVRSFSSVNTRSLLIEHGGFIYDSDASNDEIPYFSTVDGTPFLVVPYSKVYNDVKYFVPPYYGSPADFTETLKLGLDEFVREAEETGAGRMMTVGLHTRWSGQAGRAVAVRRFIEYAQQLPQVSFMRRVDIAQFWIDTFGDRRDAH